MAKGKKGSSSTPTADHGESSSGDYDSLLQSMRLAQSVLQNDTVSMQQILQESLPSAVSVLDDSVSIEKSLGESFTGGRSTPVYQVSCQVIRNQVQRERSFIVKLVLMPNDSAKDSEKLTRESYAVEHRFYHTESIQQTIRDNPNSSMTIPKVFFSDLDGTKPWAAFCILMNDISQPFPLHPTFLSTHQAQCALKWIAAFHATFWGISLPPNSVWERGAFWTKSDAYDGIASAWVGTLRFLEKQGHAVTPSIKSFGQRLKQAGPALAAFLSEKASSKTSNSNTPTVRTLIHGDFKAANLFLKQSTDSQAEEDPSADNVAVVDFQFTGAGIGAEDVAYLLYPDARGFFDTKEEALLLETYHEELISQLIMQQKGGPSSLSFDQFQRYYELSRLDMTRHWLAKGWAVSTEGEAKLVAALVDSMDQLDGGSVLPSSEQYNGALESFVNQERSS